ncbi:MAG: hypothetical protein OEZ06_07555 [Myxococcales bacterium]|nr:hypothetical protein [Myxococcales bacterium]
MNATVLRLLLAVFAAGCGSTASQVTRRPADPLSSPDAQRAAELAPDLLARAERAFRQADGEDDAGARRDQRQRGRMLLAAAIAEAERIELDRRRAEAEARIARADAGRAAAEHERMRLQRALEIERTGQRQQALQAAALRPPTAGAAQDAKGLAASLRTRARLMLAAARAMGAPERALAAAERALAAAERGDRGRSALRLAHDALTRAGAALGAARALGGETPTAEEIAALRQAASLRGLELRHTARGTTIALPGAFAEASARLSKAGRAMLEAVSELLLAHPHGAVLIEPAHTPAGDDRKAQLFAARSAALRKSLSRHLPADRVRTAADGEAGGEPSLLLPAYLQQQTR